MTMNSYSVGTYSGGTAFVGINTFLPTFNSPFNIAIGGTAIQKATVASTVIGTGFGLYATYAGFFDGRVRIPKKRIAHAQFHNATIAGVQENVGIHWMDLPAGSFPNNIPAYVDNDQESILLSAFDSSHGECVAEQVTASVKWMYYPAGYFPLNIPVLFDNGNESVVQSVLRPEPTLCAPEEAPVPIKWLEYTSQFVPNNMDLFVDDEIPFGYNTNPVCPLDSEKIERAFVDLRNPPTRVQVKPSPIRLTMETRSGSSLLHIFAVMSVLCMALGSMFFAFTTQSSILNAELLPKQPLGPQLEVEPDEAAKKKALEKALYKLGATPASRVAGCRHRAKKKPKKTNKTQKPIYNANDVEKHSFSIDPALETLD